MLNKHEKIERKTPALHFKPAFNEIYIRGDRPYPVYLKHANKVLLKHPVVIIHALTSAINKAVKLALTLMDEYPYLHQEITTDSVPTLNYTESGEQVVSEKSAIHITLSKTLIKSIDNNL